MRGENKTLLTGIKPTGRLHIGNYFGVMKDLVELQNNFNSFVFIANYHALTTQKDRDILYKDTVNIVYDYLAVGLDPNKATIFLQSDIPEVTELAWILNTLVTVPYLMRGHAYKERKEKNEEINAGILNYPVLMASDILIYSPDCVPVGNDQKQHVEIARDIAQTFNRIYGETFIVPEPLISKDKGIVIGTDGKKMSKGYENTIQLFSSDEEIKKSVMSIKTDSKGIDEKKDPEKCIVLSLHKLFSKNDLHKIKERYINGSIGYSESKEILIKNIIKTVSPMREKREKLMKNEDVVKNILIEGGKKAKRVASKKMEEIRRKVGVSFINKI